MKSLFWNAEEERLRAGWRITLFVLIASILAIPVAELVDTFDRFLEVTFTNALIMIVILGSIWFSGRYLDKRSWAGFGITFKPYRQFVLGAITGFGLVVVIFAIQFGLGWLSVDMVQFNTLPAYSFLVVFAGQVLRYLAGSVFEEAFTRGYLLKNIAEGIYGRFDPTKATIIAYIITSSIFGILHMGNDNATLLSVLNLILLGVAFGWMVIVTGKLHFAIGFHAFWNIAQNNIFGSANSGKEPVVSWLYFNNSGADVWTGGSFGPEGGLLCTIIVSLFIAGAVQSHLKKNGRLEQNIIAE